MDEHNNYHPPAPAPAQVPAATGHSDEPRTPKVRAQRRESTVALYVRIPASVAKNLKLMSVANDESQSDIVARILAEHVGQWVAPYRKSG